MGRQRDLLGGSQERRVFLSSMIILMRRGFTLVELMIALAIFGFLIMLAGPQLATFLASSQVRNAGEAIVNGVQKTQTTAIGGNTQTRFVLTPTTDTGGWLILTTDPADNSEPAANPATPCAAPLGPASINPVQLFCNADARDAKITPTPADATEITFDGFGRIQCNADGTANLQWVDITHSKNPSARALRACITNQQVAACPGSAPLASSQIKLCDPAAGAGEPQACPASCS